MYLQVEEILAGMFSTQVDDRLHSGKIEYNELTKETEEKLRCKKCQWGTIQFQ